MANKPSGGKPRGILSLVLVPALLTLVVTIVRLVGELAGWMPVLFNSHGPGPKQQQGLFGITLLIPLFGCWFGWMLRRDTGGPGGTGHQQTGEYLELLRLLRKISIT